MDLNYGPQYEDFKKEVQSFCNEYKDLRFVDSSQSPLASDGKRWKRETWSRAYKG